MTPSRLRTFLAIVDTGSARAAAQVLHVTESGVSTSLASLQQELDVPLFERRGRGLVLTESGEILAGYARRILGLMEEGISAARSGVSADHGRLRLGTVTTAGEYLLPELLASFSGRWPAVEVTLEVGVRDRVLADLADHRLDVVIAGRPAPGRALVTRAMRPNVLVVVSAPGVHEDLSAATWLLREEGSGTRAATLALHDELGIAPTALALGSHGAVVACAVLGLGVTLVPMDAVGRDLDQGRLEVRTTSKTPLKRPWHVLTGASPTATARLFIDHLLSEESGPAFKRPPRSAARSSL